MIRFVRGGSGADLTRAGILLIAALAWVAGTVNALGALMLGGVFTSHMTGNASNVVLVLLGARGRPLIGAASGLAGFFAGSFVGALLIETHPEHSSTRALWLEALMLAAGAVILWNGPQSDTARDLELAGIAAAMGVQNIALAGSVLRAHTTHITGPLTDFAGTLVRRLIGRRALARDVSHGLAVYGGRVLAFGAGIASGALLFDWAGSKGLLVPALAVAGLGTLLWHIARPSRRPARLDR